MVCNFPLTSHSLIISIVIPRHNYFGGLIDIDYIFESIKQGWTYVSSFWWFWPLAISVIGTLITTLCLKGGGKFFGWFSTNSKSVFGKVFKRIEKRLIDKQRRRKHAIYLAQNDIRAFIFLCAETLGFMVFAVGVLIIVTGISLQKALEPPTEWSWFSIDRVSGGILGILFYMFIQLASKIAGLLIRESRKLVVKPLPKFLQL